MAEISNYFTARSAVHPAGSMNAAQLPCFPGRATVPGSRDGFGAAVDDADTADPLCNAVVPSHAQPRLCLG